MDQLLVEDLRVLVWMNMPSHHQSGFFDAIRRRGINLVVVYYGNLDARRTAMGWERVCAEGDQEFFMGNDDLDAVWSRVPDYRDRIHVVPGYGARFLRRLIRFLSRSKVPWVHWSERAHNGLRWYFSYPFKRWYAHMVSAYALGAFACGRLAADDFVRWGIRRESIFFLPYSPVVTPFDAGEETCRHAGHSGCAFLFVGSLEKRKGTDILLKAFAHLVAEDHSRKCALVLVGNDKSAGRYMQMARQHEIDKRVIFVGAIPPREVSRFYADATVVILPSRFDGWGAVVNEGAAHGKALIVSDECGAAWHLVEPGVNGFLVRAGDWRSLATAMRTYADAPRLANLHGRASKELYRRFAPEANAERFAAALVSLRGPGALREAS